MSLKDRLILEDKISNILKSENKTVHFEYGWEEPTFDKKEVGQLVDLRYSYEQKPFVIAHTLNIKSGETFLLKKQFGKDHYSALLEIHDYVASNKETIDSFTVMWAKKENGRLGSTNISYFFCHDIKEVVDKFFSGKSLKDYVIYEIKLNPIS